MLSSEDSMHCDTWKIYIGLKGKCDILRCHNHHGAKLFQKGNYHREWNIDTVKVHWYKTEQAVLFLLTVFKGTVL